MQIAHTGFNRFAAQDFFDYEEVGSILYHQACDGMSRKNVSAAGACEASFTL
jgi:hypothetical protein